ncbi:type IV pilus modification PilV family protein [Neorhizobium petrolearium]|uniref:type IV pilus modification PilV family protein n=1 Tax=Neorhizobium petrolearium TaxID=515361 RepID=UPI003F7F6EC3
MTLANDSSGFTLLETLIAFMILSIALAISAETVAIASKSLSSARERQDAVRLAEVLRAEKLPGLLRAKRTLEGMDGVQRWKIEAFPAGTQASRKDVSFALITISSASGRAHKFLLFGTDAGIE